MKNSRPLILASLLLCLLVFGLSSAVAAVPHLINYQGRLTDKSGSPLSGSSKLTFRIYDAENAGNLLWEGVYNSVTINNGLFNVLLGDTSSPGYNFEGLTFDKPYWLEVKAGDDVLTPRQRITPGAYSIRSGTAEKMIVSPEDTKPDYFDKKSGNSIKIDKTAFKFDAISSAFSVFGGDGSDGDVIISRNTDISNDAKQYNNLTIEPGVMLTAKNCIIGVSGTLTINGIISANAGGFAGSAGGAQGAANPGTTGSGLEYAARALSGGGGGGSGGSGRSGCGAGGHGGSSGGLGGQSNSAAGSAPSVARQNMVKNCASESIIFGLGGGGGGGSGWNEGAGGTGGTGGGFLYIECNEFVFNSGASITANGDSGTKGGTYAGGGGGGGGGTIVVKARTITKSSGTMTANGGIGGTGGGDGASNGGAGGQGFAALVQIE